MKTLWKALTANWGLKLLALILAVIIYYSLKPNTTPELTTHDGTYFTKH